MGQAPPEAQARAGKAIGRRRLTLALLATGGAVLGVLGAGMALSGGLSGALSGGLSGARAGSAGHSAPSAPHHAAVPAPGRAQPVDKPMRIVSMNVCTDQLLMQMVAPERIRAVTDLARDPHSSGMVAEARQVPATTGAAEQVIGMQPDLVLAGTFSTRETVAILKRLGYRVVEFEPEGSFADIKANIAKMADAVGEPARGAAMIAAIDAALARVPEPAPESAPERPVYTDYQANGFISGDGALITEVANRAGFTTLGQQLGISGTRQVSLEQMLVLRPDLIGLGNDQSGPALATALFGHPALRKLLAEQRTIDLPAHRTVCGTMHTLDALADLVAAREGFS